MSRVTTSLSICVLAGALSTPFAAPAFAQSAEPAVFVTNNVSDDVTSFTANPDGTLDYVGIYPSSEGPLAASLTPNGKYLAVTHGTANEVDEVLVIFQVNSDTSLTVVLTTLVPNAPLDTLWLNDEVLAVTETNFGGSNFAHTYLFDPVLVTLTPVDSGPTGGFNTELEKHPTLPVLYANDTNNNNIYVFQYTPAGVLSLIDTLSSGATYPINPGISHDGSLLYAHGGISSGGNAVVGCSVDAAGELTALVGSPFTSPGQSPKGCAFSSDDKFLYVSHGTDATVRCLAIQTDGSLTDTGFSFDVGFQGSLDDVQVMGDYLLVTDETTALDGIAGIYSFEIQPDGSLVPVAPIYDTFGVRPEKIIVWSPPAGCPEDLVNPAGVEQQDLNAVLNRWGDPDCLPGGAHAPCPEDLAPPVGVEQQDLNAVLNRWGDPVCEPGRARGASSGSSVKRK